MSIGPATLRKFIQYCDRRASKVYCLIKLGIYRLRNRNKIKILLFTDSRGFDVDKKGYYVNPFDCYPGLLIKDYNVDYCVCPEKHTTIIDFFNRYHDKISNYDFIILHAGIVDFSPRHKSVANLMYEQKLWYDKIFGKENMIKHLAGNLEVEYEGEQMINMFSIEMAEKHLIPKLSKIKNLIWIGCNNFVDGWEGNYPKARPKNIKLVEEYSRIFIRKLPHSIDLSDWSEEEVRIFTYDNIHLTKAGSHEVFRRIKNVISNIKDMQ
jgi:hypothetical protein